MSEYEIMRRMALTYAIILIVGPLCALAVIGAGLIGLF